MSDRLRSQSQEIAQAAGRSVNYLSSSLGRKDAIAQQTAAREGIEQGLLGGLLRQCHPLAEELCRPIGGAYYWSVQEVNTLPT